MPHLYVAGVGYLCFTTLLFASPLAGAFAFRSAQKLVDNYSKKNTIYK